MKKLLLTGLTAITAVTLFAAPKAYEITPLVYEVTMKGKTTIAKNGKLDAECLANGSNSSVTYRKQGTINIKGLIWVCECDSLAGPLGYTKPSDDGCYFWDATNGKPLTKGVISWPVLHRIDNKLKKAEGVMELTADGWHLMLAGIGKAEPTTNSVGRLVTLKGNFAGYRTAPTWSWTEYGAPCTFCDSGTADIKHYDTAMAWPLCSCGVASDFTFVSGTWTIKLNKKLSQRLNDVTAITSVYTFPAYVTEIKAPATTDEPAETTPAQTEQQTDPEPQPQPEQQTETEPQTQAEPQSVTEL